MASLASSSYAKVDELICIRGKRLRSRVYLPAHQPGFVDDRLPGRPLTLNITVDAPGPG